MTVFASQIGWSSYREFEGPFYGGRQKYILPSPVTDADRKLQVITATEGGRWDAVNMYDRCICTLGLIQWGDGCALHSVQDMLGEVEKVDTEHFREAIRPALNASAARYDRVNGQFRFRDTHGRIESLGDMRRLYLGGASGKRGEWTAEQREHARVWAASLATVMETTAAQRAQRDYTVPKLGSFLFPAVRRLLWDDTDGPWQGVLRDAVLSYAANLPDTTAKFVARGVDTAQGPRWTEGWCLHILRTLVFGPGIAIWPDRYDRIRPWLETFHGVNLPDWHQELKAERDDGLDYPAGIQRALLDLGYNPGTVDNCWGKKSADALRAFQVACRIDPTGICDAETRSRLRVARARLAKA